MQSESALRLVWIYPDLLSTYGDQGNVLVLEQRARRRGIPTSRSIHVRSADPVPESGDIYLIGGGEDRPQILAAERLRRDGGLARARSRAARHCSRSARATRSWARVFGGEEGQPVAGIGLLDISSGRGQARAVGELVAEADPALGLPDADRVREPHGGDQARPRACGRCRGRSPASATATAPRAATRAASSAPTCTAPRSPATRPWPTCCSAGSPARSPPSTTAGTTACARSGWPPSSRVVFRGPRRPVADGARWSGSVDQCLGAFGEGLFDEGGRAGDADAVDQVVDRDLASGRALGAQRNPSPREHRVEQVAERGGVRQGRDPWPVPGGRTTPTRRSARGRRDPARQRRRGDGESLVAALGVVRARSHLDYQ